MDCDDTGTGRQAAGCIEERIAEEYMKSFFIARITPVCLAAAGAFFLYILLSSDVVLEPRLPGADNAPEELLSESGPPNLESEFVTFEGVPSELGGAWPRFRGADFAAISGEQVTLRRSWQFDTPKVLWSIDVGEGYAGAAVLGGRVYMLDYDRQRQRDTVRCLSFEDGREIWQYSYPVKVKRNHGMSRTVPAVTERFIVTLGPKCHVTCLDSVTGEFHWMLDLVREYGAKVPLWYAGQCPVIEDGKAILAPGGSALMIAVDCNSGEVIWETPNRHGWTMTHSSIIPMDFMGKRMYVYCGSGGVVGVWAKDGSILWETEEWKLRINIPSPVAADEGLIFLSAGYEKGSMMLRLREENGKIVAGPLFRLTAEVFGAPQQTPIFYKGYIYGVRPDEQLICMDVEGRVMWTSGSANKFGLGPYIIADGLIYVMNDSGLLTMAEATPAGFVQLGEAKVLTGSDSWAPMAIASGRLILRDLTKMICIDIAEH
ncbi:MAG: outer membrane protein assembly factor BamB family protein [Planctomycetota bacterium]|jgi:outer membrane protein assembly factor BamB